MQSNNQVIVRAIEQSSSKATNQANRHPFINQSNAYLHTVYFKTATNRHCSSIYKRSFAFFGSYCKL